jgi:hypothetical protein
LDDLFSKIEENVEALKALAKFIIEKHDEWDKGEHGNWFHNDRLDDQLSLSSHEPLVHEISNLAKERRDEVLEDPVLAPHEDLDGEECILSCSRRNIL